MPSSPERSGASVRALAAELDARVLTRRESLDDVLASAPELPARDAALLRALLFGVRRWHHRLEWQAGQLLTRPLARRDALLAALLRVGLFQLEWLRIPDHAAVSATVAAAPLLGLDRAKSLVNAVLRRYLRERATLDAALERNPEALYSHPAWMIESFRRDWPRDWTALLEANNAAPPMWLRVNPLRTTHEAYRKKLEAAGLEAVGRESPGEGAAGPETRAAETESCAAETETRAAETETGAAETETRAADTETRATDAHYRAGSGVERPVPMAPSALQLAAPCPTSRLPGYAEGEVSVQDAAAQLAAGLLALGPGQRVLDACAAPGGKTAHMLETCPALSELWALDIDPERLESVRANLDRLGLDAHLLAADAASPAEWWDGRPFDRILLDAPCTGLGVIRRHPDIKVLRTPGDIERAAARQAALLEALWPLLAPGGRLVYATCTITRAENQDQIRRFVESRGDTGGSPAAEVAIRTGEANMDGFYYACIDKQETSPPARVSLPQQ